MSVLQSLVLTDCIQHVCLSALAKMAPWFGWGFVHISRKEKGDWKGSYASTTALVARRRE